MDLFQILSWKPKMYIFVHVEVNWLTWKIAQLQLIYRLEKFIKY